jgi:hypothetical protein
VTGFASSQVSLADCRLPHFTTLQKFAQKRIKTTLLERVLLRFICAVTRVKKLFLGVDSTGFKLNKASFYNYTTALKRNGGKTVKRVKKHLKVALGVEVRKQLIAAAQKVRRGPANDAR